MPSFHSVSHGNVPEIHGLAASHSKYAHLALAQSVHCSSPMKTKRGTCGHCGELITMVNGRLNDHGNVMTGECEGSKDRPVPPGCHLVACPGEAHSNPWIDNCGLCAPRWGWIQLPKQFSTLEAYRDSLP